MKQIKSLTKSKEYPKANVRRYSTLPFPILHMPERTPVVPTVAEKCIPKPNKQMTRPTITKEIRQKTDDATQKKN